MNTTKALSFTAFLIGSAGFAAVPAQPQLTLTAHCASDVGTSGLTIRGGRENDALVLVFGLDCADLPLPGGARLRVRPDLVLAFGKFPATGILVIPVDSALVCDRSADQAQAILVQAFAVDAVDGVADPVWASNVLRLGKACDQADAFSAQLISTDSIPPYYSLAITLRVPTSGHELRLDSIDRVPSADGSPGTTIVYLRHLRPVEGTTVSCQGETLGMFLELGNSPGCKVEVWLAESEDLPAYTKKAEFKIH
jgi:hypothetical protein